MTRNSGLRRPYGWSYTGGKGLLADQETAYNMLFFLPRRFVKTCWLSTLECYYATSPRTTLSGG